MPSSTRDLISTPQAPSAQAPAHAPAATRRRIERHLQALTASSGVVPTAGNRVEVLQDGPQTYEAMFAAIEQARDHINLESYIVEAEGPGRELSARLKRKCAEGVKVNLLYDSLGSLGTASDFFTELNEAGVELCEYNPVVPWRRRVRQSLHLRDHRKLLIVDGRVAFTGGVNISSVYASRASTPLGRLQRQRADEDAHWRDTHAQVEGPVVASLQRLFLEQWRRHGHTRVAPAHYFPSLYPVGTQQVAVTACDAGRTRNPYYRALLRAIESSEQRVFITAAYFVPTRRLLQALCEAAARGVDVRLVLPSLSDSWLTLHAGRVHYGRLLRAGVRLFQRRDALLHAKTAAIDGVWSTVGSSNMDWRSFIHNAEANLIVVDADFGAAMEAAFRDDLRHSSEIELAVWQQRSRMSQAFEWIAGRFEYFL